MTTFSRPFHFAKIRISFETKHIFPFFSRCVFALLIICLIVRCKVCKLSCISCMYYYQQTAFIFGFRLDFHRLLSLLVNKRLYQSYRKDRAYYFKEVAWGYFREKTLIWWRQFPKKTKNRCKRIYYIIEPIIFYLGSIEITIIFALCNKKKEPLDVFLLK